MIQRKQTLFLIGAIIAIIVCLFLPIGNIEAVTMGGNTVLYNIGTVTDGVYSFGTIIPVLFVFMAIAGIMAIAAIFLFKNRKLQIKLCSGGIVLTLAWYVYYAFCYFNEVQQHGTFHPTVAVALPLIASCLFYLARKGVKHDENLIKSMDRIR